jgi:hypothetical protein
MHESTFDATATAGAVEPVEKVEKVTFEYAAVRVVPLVERGEFINVGVLLSCPSHRFLEARIEVDWERLKVFAPFLDLALVEEYLATLPLVCGGGKSAGPIGQLPQRARFHWLVAPRSTIVQISPVHSGLCHTPSLALEHLMNVLVRPPAAS